MNKKNDLFVNRHGNKFGDVYSTSWVYKWQSIKLTTMKQMQILRFFYFNDDF